MVANASCGDLRRLRGLLEDSLPPDEQARMTTHIEGCDACRRALEHLAAEGRWWDDLRAFARADPEASDPVVAYPGGTARDETDLVVDFLDPADEEGALGRFGPYLVLEVLGRGGMGVVLKALDPALHRVVAIKVLAPQLAASASARQRFTREARAAASVSHDHVVSIHAVDEVRGLPFLVMPYIAGRSLQERIDRAGPLEIKEILRIGMQVAQGLAAAHAQGLIHRDIKPANILLENGVERVRITDFGLARAADDASLTQSGVVAGTPQYMAPEQARGEPIDARADLFSLGSVLYAMATGHPPFRAKTVMAVLRRVSDEDPRPIRAVNPEVPEWLEAIVSRLHAKDPAARFSTASEVADTLGQHLARLQHPAHVPGPCPRPSAARRIRGLARRAAVPGSLLLAIGVLLATEAAGITHVAGLLATFLRARTQGGTLVVEVDDPGIAVTVEGAGDELVIRGAGIHEVRLRPGPHLLKATLGARTIRSEEIAIPRDGRSLVKVHRVADRGPDPAPASPTRPGRDARTARSPLPPEAPEEGVPTLAAVRSLADLRADVWTVGYSPDGRRMIWGGYSRKLVLCEPPEGPPRIIDLESDSGGMQALVFAPDGRTFARGSSDGQVWIWDAGTMQVRDTFQSQDGPLRALAFSPDGESLAAGGDDGRVKIWDLRTRRERPSPPPQPLPVSRVRYTPDGGMLVVATGVWDRPHKPGKVTFWDAATAAPLGVMSDFLSRVAALAVSPDGRIVAGGSAEGVRLWDVAAGSVVPPLIHDDWQVNCLEFSPDGRFLAAGYNRGDLVVWDVVARRKWAILEGHHGVVSCVAFSPDGRTVAGGGWDSKLLFWDLARRPRGAPGPGEPPAPETHR